MGAKNAKGVAGPSSVRSTQTRRREQGKGSEDRAVENGSSTGDGQTAEVPAAQGAGKAALGQGYLNLTEENAKAALIEARGDIFIASQLLYIPLLRLTRAIEASPILQATRSAIADLPKHNLSHEEIHQAVEQRVSLYRVVGLDALHDLATMPIDENSAQNQVKLAAAARLAGTTESSGAGDLADTLRQLNDAYQQNAPRLRVIRERTTIETLPAERVIDQEPSSSD